jgi:hypothetical protein
VATKKAVAPRKQKVSRVAAPSPQPPAVALPSYEDDGRIHGLLSVEEEALEAVGAL